MFQHGLGIHLRCWKKCSNIPGMIQCTWVHAYLYTRLIYKRKQLFLNLMTKKRTYLYIISWAFIPKGATIFIKWYDWKFRKMFLLLRTFLIFYWFMFCKSVGWSTFFWIPTRFVSPYCFSIKGRLQDLIRYSSHHTKKFSF